MVFIRKRWSADKWVAYASLVLVSLGMSAIIWSAEADNKLFVCTDSVGAPFDFIPPFVHDCCGDHYVASPLRVWSFWGSLVAGSFLLPAVAVLLVIHIRKLILPKEEPPIG